MRRLLVDEQIPWAEAAFSGFGTVQLVAGRAITPAQVQSVEVLLIRSVTRVTAGLIAGSRVQFVGSATIGLDHVDLDALHRQKVAFAHAPGSNAISVVEYVLAGLFAVAHQRGVDVAGKRVGILGVGHIGAELARRLAALGMEPLRNDPPRAAREGGSFLSLETVLRTADIVTCHVPLVREGRYSTRHLISTKTLGWMRKGAWLINTSRGGVVNGNALHTALAKGHLGATILDVWEDEPTPDPALIGAVDLGTPHIAGHSYDGKVAGTVQLYEALAQFLKEPPSWRAEALKLLKKSTPIQIVPPDPHLPQVPWMHAIIQQMYPIATDHARFRQILNQSMQERGAYFTQLRKTYPKRRSFARFVMSAQGLSDQQKQWAREGLGVQLEEE